MVFPLQPLPGNLTAVIRWGAGGGLWRGRMTHTKQTHKRLIAKPEVQFINLH